MTGVYLAGAIQHKEDNGKEWRDAVTDDLVDRGVDVLNPLEQITVDCATQAVVQQDKELLEQADAVFVRWEILPMTGTPMEIYRCYERGVPVVVWATCPVADVSGWVFEHSVVTPNREVAVETVAQLA
jgi:hypothetical protein